MKKIMLDKLTGEELKTLLEQRSEAGIETLPDVIDFLRGIGKDETLLDYIRRIVGELVTVPENAVGSEQIQDDAVQERDLTPELREKIRNAQGLTDDERQTLEELKNISTLGKEGAERMVADAIAAIGEEDQETRE